MTTEDEFFANVAAAGEGVHVICWVATWCRKCIYLKPKLKKILDEDDRCVRVPSLPQGYTRPLRASDSEDSIAGLRHHRYSALSAWPFQA